MESSPSRGPVAWIAYVVAFLALLVPASAEAQTTSGVTFTPGPSTASVPQVDYHAFDDIALDGRRAFGRAALFRVWRSNTEATQVTVHPCQEAAGLASVELTYSAALQDLVRALPTADSDHCARVHFRIRSRDAMGVVHGTLLAVLDVRAVAAAATPPGVDFTTMDDISLAGTRARGRVAEFTIWRGETTDRTFDAFPCGSHGGLTAVRVVFAPAQRDAIRNMPTTSADACQRIRFRLTSRDSITNEWTATLLEVGPLIRTAPPAYEGGY
jgi:hypothetical protein